MIPIPPTPDPFQVELCLTRKRVLPRLSWSSEAKAWLEKTTGQEFTSQAIPRPFPGHSTSPVTFCCKKKTVTTTNPNV